MPRIIITSPVSSIKHDIYEVKPGTNLLDWMIENLPSDLYGLHSCINLNGSEIVNTAFSSKEASNNAIDITLNEGDDVRIVARPADPFTLVIGLVVALVAVKLMLPKPKIPSLDGVSSSNSQLTSASNSYRLRQAKIDIGGLITSTPDFAQLSYYIYEGDRRVFDEVFIIGVGHYNIIDMMEAETSFSDIPGYSWSVVKTPGSAPFNGLNVRPVRNLQDVDLVPPQRTGNSISLGKFNVVNSSTIRLRSLSLYNYVKGNTSVGEDVGVQAIFFSAGAININSEILSFNDSTRDIEFATTSFPITSSTGYGSIIKIDPNDIGVMPFYVAEGDAVESIIYNLTAPSGLQTSEGNRLNVEISCEAELINPDGTPSGTVIRSLIILTGDSTTPISRTVTLDSSDGIVPGKYRVRAVRNTGEIKGGSVELVMLENISTVTPYTSDFGDDCTIVQVRRESNDRVSRGQSQRVRARVNRELNIFNPTTGTFASSTSATRSFAQYVMYLLVERMGVPVSNISYEELFEIELSVPDPRLAYFDGFFDDKNLSARDRLETVCNAARVRYWNEGDNWSFVRMEKKAFPSAIFCRRNLKLGQSSYTRTFRRPSDFDSVTVIYVNDATNSEKRISRRVLSNGDIVAGVGMKPVEFNFSNSIRNDYQAENRLEYEIRRLVYEREAIKDTALSDVQLVRIGERVLYCNLYDDLVFHGELIDKRDGDSEYMISERFEPEDGKEYYIQITNQRGEVSESVRAYPVDGEPFLVRTDEPISGYYAADVVFQAGSRYIIGTMDELNASSFIFVGRGQPNELGEASIELVNYDERIFEMDPV